MEALRRGLDQAAMGAQQIPVWLLVAGHSLSTVDAFRSVSPYWLVSWLLGFFAAFGGGTLSALLLRSPATAAIALFAKNEVGLVYTFVWWAFLYFPANLVARAYDNTPPVRVAARACRAALRATTVVQRVNAAVKLHPGVVAAPLIIGTLAGTGGKLIVEACLHCMGRLSGPSELSRPSFALRSAALGALAQYLLVHVLGVLSPQQGLGLVITVYVAHSLAADITGEPCDFTAPLGDLFYKLTWIPDPAQLDSPKAAAATIPATATRAGAAAKPSRPSTARGRSRSRSAAAPVSPARAPRGRRAADENDKGDELAAAAAALLQAAVKRRGRRSTAAQS